MVSRPCVVLRGVWRVPGERGRALCSAEIRTGLEDFSGTAFSADLGGSSKYSNGENTSQRGSSLKTEEKKGSM